MKWLRTLLQRDKKSENSTNALEYEFQDPLYREPPWSIPIPLPAEKVIEMIEQDFISPLVSTYQVIASIPLETENGIIKRYTVVPKQQDRFRTKQSPKEALVCIVVTHKEQAVSKSTTEKEQIREQAKPTGQEIVLHDPYEVMKPWGMAIPLDYARFHFEDSEFQDLEFEDLEKDPKSII